MLFFVFLAGRADGRQTVNKDLPYEEDLIFQKLMLEHPEWEAWYNGGDNVKWNPSLPSIPWLNVWFADAWHTEKHHWIICFSIALGIQVLTVFTLLFNIWFGLLAGIIAAVIFNAVEGTTFRIYYGHVYRATADKWTTVFKDWNPFVNSRKAPK